jgi:protein-S-isoprenylcysteine O-methyltransferase Ste14
VAALTPAKPVNQRRRIAALRLAFLFMLPLMIFSRSAWDRMHWAFELLEVIGIALIIVAVLGRFWAVLYIGQRKNATVMQDGPYSVCRHPLYLFSTIGVVGFAMMLGSVVVAAILGMLTFLILQMTASREETFLRATFGQAYEDYAARVPRIIPKISMFSTPTEITFSVASLRANFFDAMVFLSFIPLAELLKELKEYGLIPTFPLY